MGAALADDARPLSSGSYRRSDKTKKKTGFLLLMLTEQGGLSVSPLATIVSTPLAAAAAAIPERERERESVIHLVLVVGSIRLDSTTTAPFGDITHCRLSTLWWRGGGGGGGSGSGELFPASLEAAA